MMVIELIPTHMSTLAAFVLCVATRTGTTEQAFGAFSGTTCRLLIGAFGLAAWLHSDPTHRRARQRSMVEYAGLGVSKNILII